MDFGELIEEAARMSRGDYRGTSVSARIGDVLSVLTEMRRRLPSRPVTPNEVANARHHAVLSVAAKRGIDPGTVRRHCRDLVGIVSKDSFEALILRWWNDGDRLLARKLQEHTTWRKGYADSAAIDAFFEKPAWGSATA